MYVCVWVLIIYFIFYLQSIQVSGKEFSLTPYAQQML
jgi:hypothetical protein